MNYEEYEKEMNEKNDEFIANLNCKPSFMFDWHEGAVVPVDNPNYYNGRIFVSITKVFKEISGTISFGRDNYPVTEEIVNNLYNYVEKNIDKLVKIALNQGTEILEGGMNDLKIKYKNVYLSIDGGGRNVSPEDIQEIHFIKDDIRKIILGDVNINEIGDRMSVDKKIELAKEVYTKIGTDISNITFDSIRYNDIDADLIYILDNSKGSIGLIINDKGEYLLCGSNFGINYWKEEFKNGKRDIFM